MYENRFLFFVSQCELPELPVDCLVSLTFTPAYVDRMRSPVITHVTKLVLEIHRR
jgi:hypothetical protein